MSDRLFCSAASLEQAEPLPGLGNPFARVLLVRAPRGEWRTLRQHVVAGEGRLGAAVKAAITLSSRVLFVDGGEADDVPALLSYPDAVTVRTTEGEGAIEDMIIAWCAGDSLPGKVDRRITILCCTDGRTDPCCARFGMATYRALSEAADNKTFNLLQSSHLGGCRFATTIVTLPDNARYGRLTPEEVPEFLVKLAAGGVYLPALRGIGGLAEAAQVATVGAMHWAADQGLNPARVVIDDGATSIADADAREDGDSPTCKIPLRVGNVELVAFLRRERFPLLDNCPSPDASYRQSHPRWVLEAMRPAAGRTASAKNASR
jgi:(2Fe-2S) ferredoxin